MYMYTLHILRDTGSCKSPTVSLSFTFEHVLIKLCLTSVYMESIMHTVLDVEFYHT